MVSLTEKDQEVAPACHVLSNLDEPPVQQRLDPRIKSPRRSTPRLRHSTQSHYDRLSRWYDLLTAWGERPAHTAGLSLLNARQGETILEVGFGTGQAVLELANSVGDSGKVFGVDLSWGMVARAWSKIGSAGQSGRIMLAQGDAIGLPFRTEVFDAIFMSFTLELFSDTQILTVMSECQRVLKKGGRSCVTALLRKENANLITRLYDWAHRCFPAAFDCRPIFVPEIVSCAGLQIEQAIEIALWGMPVMLALLRK